MREIGIYQSRKILWIDYFDLLKGKMPFANWVCLATANDDKPELESFDLFTRNSIENGILEFKGHGTYGEVLHDWFDETMVVMETVEGMPEIDVMTTWHNDQSLANAFWQCFFATCLPESADYENITIVCTDLDGLNRELELREYLTLFEKGWLPEE